MKKIKINHQLIMTIICVIGLIMSLILGYNGITNGIGSRILVGTICTITWSINSFLWFRMYKRGLR